MAKNTSRGAKARPKKITVKVSPFAGPEAASSAKRIENILELFRQKIAVQVERHANTYAQSINLEAASSEFLRNVVDAIVLATALHGLDPPIKRYSDIRKELLQVSKAAAEVAKQLGTLDQAVADLTPSCIGVLNERCETNHKISDATFQNEMARFDQLSKQAYRLADTCKGMDKGGASRKYEFIVLIHGLARAFKIATVT